MSEVQLKTVNVVGAALVLGKELLLFRRLDQGKLEFPGGKLEVGESLHEALVRELEEELGIDRTQFSVGALLGEDQLILPTKALKLSVFWVSWPQHLSFDQMKLIEHSEYLRFSAQDLEQWDQIESEILPLDRALVRLALINLSSLTF